jgi:hypothetical protein
MDEHFTKVYYNNYKQNINRIIRLFKTHSQYEKSIGSFKEQQLLTFS